MAPPSPVPAPASVVVAKAPAPEPEEVAEAPARKPRPKARVAEPAPRAAPPPAPKPVVETPKPAQPPANRGESHARYRAGSALLLQGQFQAAVTEFREALKLDKRNADAHRGLGVAFSSLQRKADAMRHYESYLRMRPGAADRDTVREALQDLKN